MVAPFLVFRQCRVVEFVGKDYIDHPNDQERRDRKHNCNYKTRAFELEQGDVNDQINRHQNHRKNCFVHDRLNKQV
jgi:hypothetical protein